MWRSFPIKKRPNGQALLNVACGIYMHGEWNNVDFNPYTWIVHYPRLAALLKELGILSAKRYARMQDTDAAIIRWDLRKGIPFPDRAFDTVYHSHFLEHLPKKGASAFLKECYRVLKAGGILRVVVPDLKYWAEHYVRSATNMRQGTVSLEQHEENIDNLIGQMVHDEHSSTREQRPLIRLVERLVRGSTAQTGELHRWMYDSFTLREALAQAGFGNIQEQTAFSSRLTGWADFCLDTDKGGAVRKPESLFVEAEKQA